MRDHTIQFLDALTINEETENRDNLMEIIWEAFDYFPQGTWEGIKYLGNICMKHDLKIRSKDRVYRGFIFNDLMRRVRKVKKLLESDVLMLALTHDPVIAIYHRLEVGKFKRIVDLVRDFVSKDVGLVSLFEIEEKTARKIAAHGLGHNQGLKHHAEPVDLMYAGLLYGDPIERDGFCGECERRLKNRTVVEYSI